MYVNDLLGISAYSGEGPSMLLMLEEGIERGDGKTPVVIVYTSFCARAKRALA